MPNVHVVDPLLVTMTPLIEKHMKRSYVKIKMMMNKYVKLDGMSITELFEGILYYLTMVKFSKRYKRYAVSSGYYEGSYGK